MASPHIIICFDGSATAKQAIIDTANLHPTPPVVILTAWQPMESYVLAWGVMIGD
ncbi:MAG: hypothetical protein H7287_10490, partial [Thermoleophilia bacterium]|nr:hypothetical protein [Thermoleophilia bacterium]